MPFIAPFVPLLLTAGAGAAGSLLGSKGSGGGGSSGGSGEGDNKPQTIDPIFPDLQARWGEFLAGQLGQGATPYTGQRNYGMQDTLIPGAAGQWRASGPQGSDRLRDYAAQGWNPGGTDIGFLLQNNVIPSMMNYGTLGGAPSDAMYRMMNYGGAGSIGQPAMNSLLNYGVASEAGRGLNNMWQYGIASEQSGRPLINRAYGEDTAASRYLAPFMNAQAYRAPAINPLQLSRATTRVA